MSMISSSRELQAVLHDVAQLLQPSRSAFPLREWGSALTQTVLVAVRIDATLFLAATSDMPARTRQ